MPTHAVLPARRRLHRHLFGGGVLMMTGLAAPPALARLVAAHPGLPLALTPAATAGPFYPPQFAADPTDSLLQGFSAKGEPTSLSGRVVDAQGRAQPGLRIELWQCDGASVYHHPAAGSGAARDPGFKGFGWQHTDASGHYAFQTIRPVPYPGRTPHIHILLKRGQQTLLVTQVYLPGEQARNRRDFLFSRLGATAPLALASMNDAALRFDIVLG